MAVVLSYSEDLCHRDKFEHSAYTKLRPVCTEGMFELTVILMHSRKPPEYVMT
jgi:hypothetical protein